MKWTITNPKADLRAEIMKHTGHPLPEIILSVGKRKHIRLQISDKQWNEWLLVNGYKEI